jgi:hypothetical protein
MFLGENYLNIIFVSKKKKEYGYKVSKYFVVPSVEFMESNFLLTVYCF